jgi:hypothetical protein
VIPPLYNPQSHHCQSSYNYFFSTTLEEVMTAISVVGYLLQNLKNLNRHHHLKNPHYHMMSWSLILHLLYFDAFYSLMDHFMAMYVLKQQEGLSIEVRE